MLYIMIYPNNLFQVGAWRVYHSDMNMDHKSLRLTHAITKEGIHYFSI